MILVDTSVAVAAALPWHADHTAARSALPRVKSRMIAQVAIETYSVLTRLPPPQRIPAMLARDYLRDAFAQPPIVLSASAHRRLLDIVAAEEIAGSGVYDALVAATAKQAGATLLTLDRRATAAYQQLQVDYRLIG